MWVIEDTLSNSLGKVLIYKEFEDYNICLYKSAMGKPDDIWSYVGRVCQINEVIQNPREPTETELTLLSMEIGVELTLEEYMRWLKA